MDNPVMVVVVVVAGVLLLAGALAAIYRIIKGPTVLDRVVASDVLVATMMCAMGIEMAVNQHTYTLPVVLVLAMFAMVGSISISRFVSKQDES